MHDKGANIRLLKQPSLNSIWERLSAPREQGCDSLKIDWFWFAYVEGVIVAYPPEEWAGGERRLIWRDEGQDPAHPYRDTTPASIIEATIHIAKALGFRRIILCPMIDLYYRGGSWRGEMMVPISMRDEWYSAYKYFLEDAVQLARRYPDVMLCFGAELVKVTEILGVEFWVKVANWLRWRGVKKAQLIYAANWGWEDLRQYNGLYKAEVNLLRPMYPRVGAIGINWYGPMANRGDSRPLTVDMLHHGEAQNIGWGRRIEDAEGRGQPWCMSHREMLQDLARLNIPIIVTEIGYGASRNAVWDPAGDVPPGERTFAWSLPLWQAAREELEQIPNVVGWYVWEAGLNQTEGASHDIVGTPVAAVAWGE